MKSVTPRNTDISWTAPQFWADLILKAGKIDFGDPLPALDERFVSVWASHYAAIADMTQPKSSVLEVGAGYAVLAAGLGHCKDAKVWATDHPTRTYVFRKDYHAFLQSHNVFLVAQELGEGLPFQSDSFSHVYGCDVIEHLLPSVATIFLAETARVLKPGGKFVLSTPNRARLSKRAQKILGQNNPPTAQRTYAGATLGHVREYTASEITRLLKQHGLQPMHHAFGLIPYFAEEDLAHCHRLFSGVAAWINQVASWLKPLVPSLGDEMYILSRKL